MPEPRKFDDPTPNYDETRQAQNPPNSVLSRPARRGALISFLGPVVVLFLIMGLGLLYWNGRRAASAPARPAPDQTVGTAGDTTPGGGDPQPHPNSTQNELELRGVNQPAQGPMPGLHDRTPITHVGDVLQQPNDVAGRSVDLANVTVDSVSGDVLWVREGDDKVQVVVAPGLALQKGAKVRVIGTVETPSGTARVHASKIETR